MAGSHNNHQRNNKDGFTCNDMVFVTRQIQEIVSESTSYHKTYATVI